MQHAHLQFAPHLAEHTHTQGERERDTHTHTGEGGEREREKGKKRLTWITVGNDLSMYFAHKSEKGRVCTTVDLSQQVAKLFSLP